MFHSASDVFLPIVVDFVSSSPHGLLAFVVLGLFNVDLSDVWSQTSEEEGPDGGPPDSEEFETDDFFGGPGDMNELDEFSRDDEFPAGSGDDGFEVTSSGATDPLEPRIDEIESDIESISNTIGTVRSENEQIKDSVASVEENVRKLLDVYEYVTNDANPFVDEVSETDRRDDSFDLFSGTTETETQGFDDETVKLTEDLFGPVDDSPSEPDTTETVDEGRTFEELKAEYVTDDRPEFESDAGFQFESPNTPTTDSQPDSEQDADESSTRNDTGDHGATTSNRSAEVYLDALPEGYGTELILLEWVEYLYRHGGTRGTHQAIAYYKNLSWIGEDVGTELRTILSGIAGEIDREGPVARADGAGEPALGIEHHRKSLEYISLLTGWEVTPHTFDIPGGPPYGV